MTDKIKQASPPNKIASPQVAMPVDEIRIQRQQIVTTILRVTVMTGALAVAVAVYDAYVDQRAWQIPFLIGAYVIITLTTVWRGISYVVQVYVILLVLYGLGIYELISYAQTGDAFLFMLTVPLMATLFLGPRSGWITLIVMILTQVAFAVAYIFGYLSPYNNFSTNINSWMARITLFIMLSLVLILPQSHLFRYLVAALRQRSQAQASLQKLNRELDQRVRQRTTELAQAKKTADEARQTAETANQAKSIFLANMSHELRTPLNSILGFSQLMRQDPTLTTQQKQDVGIINRSGQHLLALINDVLDMSKIEAGRMTLIESDFDLYRLLDDLESMFRVRVMDKGLDLSLERAPDIPRHICADEGKLRQVLINLLGNAVKFTETGQVTLRVRREETSDNALLFKIEDTGPGITPAELDRIFEPFIQTERGETQGGTGLGLAISHQFVQLMGGELQVESTVGQGSIFRFKIQANQVESAEIPAVLPGHRVIGLAPDQPTYRLLVVDDHRDNRTLLVKLLRPLGFELREAVNGQESIEIWKEWYPDLIWMDMRMPVMDGYEATRFIKSNADARVPIIIALTASSFEKERATILAIGCDDFLGKPFLEAEIFEMLRKHLGVQYIYQDKAPAVPAEIQKQDQPSITAADLAVLPHELLVDFKQAVKEINVDRTNQIIDQIHQENETLALTLAQLVENFRFDTLQTLTEEIEP